MAWAREKNDNYGGGDDNYRSKEAAGSPAQHDEVAEIDDNYNGGDDNYPRVVVEMGAEGREEKRGWNRQK